ncbi:MAG: phenylalanine--tRNA ligase subunit beta, partial [Eubacterium sp.]|nr:phenylalanine--tRNA ligase subunit beta [Eubacterium sp.]
HPVVSKKIDKKAAIVFAELDVKAFAELSNDSISYEEPSKFPAIEIDLSFVSDKFAPIANAIENAKSTLVKKVEVVDTYADENAKSITTRITFSHPEKTLTREEVMNIVDGIVAGLKEKGIALKK